MNYDEISDEKFYNLTPEQEEEYLRESYKNIRKLEILEKIDFSQWTKDELLDLIDCYEWIKLAQEQKEFKERDLTTISDFVKKGTYMERQFEFEEYKILEPTEEMQKEIETGNKRKLRPCIMLHTLALEKWTRRELLDLIKEYDGYVTVVTVILKEPSLSVLNYLLKRKYCGRAREPYDQYDKETMRKIIPTIRKRNEAIYIENVCNALKEIIKENDKILKIHQRQKNFIILNIEKFTRVATSELKKMGYKVYFYGDSYQINNRYYDVKADEVLVAIKSKRTM